MIRLYGQAPGRISGAPMASYAEQLAEMAGVEVFEWLARVESKNLLMLYPGQQPGGKGDRFPMIEARVKAARLRKEWEPGDFILMAGKNVARAFGFKPVYFEWQHESWGGVAASVIPHPSRVNHFWNKPDAAELVGRHLRATLLEANEGRAA